MKHVTRREFLQVFSAASVGFLLSGCSSSVSNQRYPNIVLIVADDMGYGDASCYNPDSQIPTPNIDSLAQDGMKFTDAHAPGAVCVPSRYGMLTGQYPFNMPEIRDEPRITSGQLTVGGLLQDAGYFTACVGKWHLGFDGGTKLDRDFSEPMTGGPVDRGFDYYYGIPASLDIPPYYYIENDQDVQPPTDQIGANSSEGWSPIQGAFWREGGVAPDFEHDEVLPRFIDKANEFLDTHAEERADQPFFLYLPLAAPHTPWLPSEKYEDSSGAGMYGDFVRQVDAGIGDVLSKLDELELVENTLVIFTSDNGPVWYDNDTREFDHDSAGMLRGMKGDIWEAGHRMPFLARWPGRIQPGSESVETICFTDILATCADLVGNADAEIPEESVSILPALLDEDYQAPLRETTLHQSSRGFFAVRKGKWKLIDGRGSGGFTRPSRIEPEEGEPAGQLYDLEADLREENNLYQDHPEVVKELMADLRRITGA